MAGGWIRGDGRYQLDEVEDRFKFVGRKTLHAIGEAMKEYLDLSLALAECARGMVGDCDAMIPAIDSSHHETAVRLAELTGKLDMRLSELLSKLTDIPQEYTAAYWGQDDERNEEQAPNPPEPWTSISGAAEQAGMHYGTLHAWVKQGRVRSLDYRGRQVIAESDIPSIAKMYEEQVSRRIAKAKKARGEGDS